MLTVLLHSGVGDISAVVTRYFGGTLLGKGGLVKAYSGGVQLALQSLPLSEKVETSQITVMIDYATVTPLKRVLPEFEAEVLAEEYGVDVIYTLEMPDSQVEPFTEAIVEMTNGQALIEPMDAASAP
jgi:putative IMPACT (imprinted ancient) family translation regulator